MTTVTGAAGVVWDHQSRGCLTAMGLAHTSILHFAGYSHAQSSD